MSDDRLVACLNCGVVYKREIAADHIRCPTCDITTRNTTSLPKVGRVHMWWDGVDL
jgi:uncharacterized C2H2 Zn-finger protein